MMIGTTILGGILNFLIVFAPRLAIRRDGSSLSDPRLIAFAIIITLFYLAELPHRAGRVARRSNSKLDGAGNWLAAFSCSALLSVFWISLVEYTIAERTVEPGRLCAAGILAVIGISLRYLAIHTLRDGFITEPTPDKGRPLVISGVYAWVRHPSETGLLCVVLGVAALLGSSWGTVAICVSVVPLMLVRLHVEEKALLATFGTGYESYMRTVGRLIPLRARTMTSSNGAGRWRILRLVVCATLFAHVAKADDDKISALLARHCLECHNASDHKGGLDLTRREPAIAGGDSGPVLIPGNPEASLLVKRIEAGEMPPEGRTRLAAEERSSIRDWVTAGAKWMIDPIDPFRYTSERRAGYDWWSLRPLRPVDPPAVENSMWPANPIDHFILHKLEQGKLAPSPAADRQTLIRRVSFDLLGLPPSPEDVAEFVNNPDPKAYEQLVDRLLDSPHYGERWARHWLDIVRYGESQGFERNKLRENAWKYRDYVIESFNSDVPYDEFIRCQLAGDVLHPEDPLAVVASGFLVMGPYDLTAYTTGTQDMRLAAREEELEGLVATVCQTFLGLTVNCGRCHDHKFDPVTQREFYQISAALGGTYHGDQRELLNDASKAAVEPRIAMLKQEIDSIAVREASADPRLKSELAARKSRLESVSRLLTGGPVHTTVPQQPASWRILARGDYRQPGEVVTPRGIAALTPVAADWKLSENAPEAERRKALAAWIADPNNPLTSRVIVNRLWGYYFGEGLVRTPSDFGFQGGMPSHPELLDWLAGQLVHPHEGRPWSLKRIQRLIVTSAAYRQASALSALQKPTPQNDPRLSDADNRLIWRRLPKRLDAETYRDSVLMVSGQLDLKLGGPGFRDFTVSSAGNNERYSVFDAVGPEFNRRSIYRTWLRGGTSPLLDTLDCPDPSVATPRRSVTSTPLQALTLLNNAFVEYYAAKFAERLKTEFPENTGSQVRRAFALAFSRQPTPDEIAYGEQFVGKHDLTQLCIVLMNANEFMFVD